MVSCGCTSKYILNDPISIVIDQNDNTPSFLQDEYSFSIAENTGQFSGLNVSASDPDEGPSGMITYSIVQGNEEGVFILGM